MRMLAHYYCYYSLWVLLLLKELFVLQTKAQPGFISINCGGADYNDSSNIQWISDVTNTSYINYGDVATIQSGTANNVSVPLTTLRYFNKGSKSCYTFQDGINNGTTYLVRASFLYGNYDKLNNPPSFVLLLNYDVWVANVTPTLTETVTQEIIYASVLDSLSVCLAPAGKNDTPFISTLEIRTLNSTMYGNGALIEGYGLRVLHRINYGATSSEIIRYPDDDFDRIWEANTTGYKLTTNETNIKSNDASDPELTPSKVMATAMATPNNSANYNLSFDFPDISGVAVGFRIDFHLAELLSSPTDRTMTVYINNVSFGDTYSLDPIFTPYLETIDRQAQILPDLQIVLAANTSISRYGPLLNGMEVMKWTDNPLATSGTLQSDFDAIHNVRTTLNLQSYGDGDPCTPSTYSWTWISCNGDTNPRIIGLNLSNFNLNGTIPQSINLLSKLKTIDLSNNNLSGTIPNLTSLTSLQVLDLHNNSLTGEIPQSLNTLSQLKTLNVKDNNLCGDIATFMQITNFTYTSNNNLCPYSNCTCSSSTKSSSGSHKTTTYLIVIVILATLYFITMVAVLVCYRRMKKKQKILTTPTKKGNEEMKDVLFTTQSFTYEEIRQATNDFTTKIGEGGFGPVYKGLLNGEVVAVKLLSDASKQGVKAFSTEVSILSRVRHKNLVSLLGFCTELQYMLIYEYVSKGNLRDLLHGDVENEEQPLDWGTRLQIALDAAQGLEYLHTGCDPIIIHRDVKSSNILLNENMQAKVADFGLSRLKSTDIDVSHVSTMNVVGTVGYLDPEYNKTNQLTDKSDVYSFGVVLLELICNRPAIDVFNSPPHIIDWVRKTVMSGNIGDVVDKSLMNKYKKSSMMKMVDIALGCVELEKTNRPTMSDIVQVIKEVTQIEVENLPESTDVSNSSITSENKPNTLRYIESLRMHLEPR